MSQSGLEQHMARDIRVLRQEHAPWLEEPDTEYRFDSKRRWRLDFAWPALKIAIEVHGGQWKRGRHVRGKGFENDREKINEAQLQGWRVFEFTGDQVRRGDAYRFLERAFPPV